MKRGDRPGHLCADARVVHAFCVVKGRSGPRNCSDLMTGAERAPPCRSERSEESGGGWARGAPSRMPRPARPFGCGLRVTLGGPQGDIGCGMTGAVRHREIPRSLNTYQAARAFQLSRKPHAVIPAQSLPRTQIRGGNPGGWRGTSFVRANFGKALPGRSRACKSVAATNIMAN